MAKRKTQKMVARSPVADESTKPPAQGAFITAPPKRADETMDAASATERMTDSELPAGAGERAQMMKAAQQTVGNTRVSRMVSTGAQNELAISRGEQLPPTGPSASPAIQRVEALMQLAQTPEAIRAALAADPSLGAAIQAFFAMGNDNPTLNSLLAQAFPSGGRLAAVNESAGKTTDKPEQTTTDKAGTGAGATLPGDRADSKVLTKGTYKWSLSAETTSRPKFTADFKPDHTKVEAKTVSFAQTVVNQQGANRFYPGGTRADPAKEKATYEPFEETTKHTRIDFHPGTENDPYYGAQWDQATKKWVKEATPGSAVGSSERGVSSTSATMQDRPERDPVARESKGDVVTEFETVPIVLETREPLGSLKWGLKIKDQADAPLELTGATKADCVDAPSAEWGKAMDKFYEARFDTILDNFDIAKFDLKPDHKTKLDGIVTRMKANPALKAQLGGAADLTGGEEFNQKLSLKRAEAARDYLVAKGIAAGRIEVESYSFDWARVEAAKGTSEGKNRRVQVWLR